MKHYCLYSVIALMFIQQAFKVSPIEHGQNQDVSLIIMMFPDDNIQIETICFIVNLSDCLHHEFLNLHAEVNVISYTNYF